MSRMARLGLTIFGAMLILFAAIFLVGDKQFLFSPTYRVQAHFDTVAGLMNGAEVRVGGVRKGMVEDIRLPQRPGEKMVVILSLENPTREVIKKDSTASIGTEGLLGNKYVSVSFGSPGAPLVRDGDTIQSQPPIDLSDLITKTDELMNRTNSTLKNVEAATGDLKSITSKINQGEGTAGAFINDRQVYDDFRDATKDVRATVAEAKVGMTAFQENMQALKKNWFFRGFFKDRGYSDSTQLTRNEISKLPEELPLQKFTYDAKEIFSKPDNAKLKKEKSLDRVGEFLEKTPFGLVVITSYAGAAGDKDENLVLTRARAVTVRGYLTGNFKIDDVRIKTKGMGEDERIGSAEAGRIEILVYGEGLEKRLTKQEKRSSNNHEDAKTQKNAKNRVFASSWLALFTQPEAERGIFPQPPS